MFMEKIRISRAKVAVVLAVMFVSQFLMGAGLRIDDLGEFLDPMNNLELSARLTAAGYTFDVPEFSVDDDEEYSSWKHFRTPDTKRTALADALVNANGSVPDSARRETVYYVSLAPEVLLQAMLEDGWKIVVENGSYSGFDGVEETGYADMGAKIVSLRPYEAPRAALHELGHVLMVYYGGNSDAYDAGIENISSPEIWACYLHQTPGSPYIYLNYDEVMAELFLEYTLYPKELYAQSPTMFAVYNTALSRLAARFSNITSSEC